MSMFFLGRVRGWRREVERKRWREKEGGLMEVEVGVQKEEKSEGEGLKGGARREEWKLVAVRRRLDLNLRAREVAIGI